MQGTPVTAYLSLGSNVGDRLESLRRACRMLDGDSIRVRRISSIYETEPVDLIEQDWFLNCVVEIETALAPQELLDRLHGIELQLGRRRGQPKGPRTIDIDILLYGERSIRTEKLSVPHPQMLRRRFVLEPLCEIAPSLQVPESEKRVEEFVRELKDCSEVRRIDAGLWV